MDSDVHKTFGALLVGGIIATLFCGITQAQTFVYFRMYSSDQLTVRLLVIGTWLLDTLHTIFITLSLWHYFIIAFGDAPGVDYVPTSLALTIAVTAILTFMVHWFFIYRVFVLSRRSYLICVPLGLIASTRLCFACLTTSKLIALRSLEQFVVLYSWSFTSGLTLSAIFDVLIMFLMCFLLKIRQRQYSKLNVVLDSLILYALECGMLTTVAALLSLTTWLTMKHNLVFMASHFVIIKFYANSLLATLNARRDLTSGGRLHNSTTGMLSNHALDHLRSANQPIVFSNGFSVGGPNHLPNGLGVGGGMRLRPVSSTSAFSEGPSISKEYVSVEGASGEQPLQVHAPESSSRHEFGGRVVVPDIDRPLPVVDAGRSRV